MVTRYARAMEEDLKAIGVAAPVMVMQSSGGMMPIDSACELPIHIIESGPAAGVTGVHHLARRMGVRDAMTLDMGGTTAKAALIEDGEISRSPEYEVGGEVSIGHRLMKGSGYLLRVPSIDLAEVGAGGGSIAWIDPAGALKVGPESAGAVPGPACYDGGRGGADDHGCERPISASPTARRSRAGRSGSAPTSRSARIRERIAEPLGIDAARAAWGIRTIANSALIRALRAVSTERGRDPRRFTLFAFGGMGPVQALDVADELGMETVVIPPLPGLFSSLGLLFAEVEHHLVRTHYASAAEPDFERLAAVVGGLLDEAEGTLEREGVRPVAARGHGRGGHPLRGAGTTRSPSPSRGWGQDRGQGQARVRARIRVRGGRWTHPASRGSSRTSTASTRRRTATAPTRRTSS